MSIAKMRADGLGILASHHCDVFNPQPQKVYDKYCRSMLSSEKAQQNVFRMKIGYMRVSSESDRQNTNLQRDALIQSGVDPRHLFEDKMSGISDKRPGLDKALAYLQPGDCLVVWKLDRLGRSLSHLLSIIADLRTRGIAFASLTEHMDTTTPHGDLMFNLFGSLAQYERALIKERINAGLEAARKRGRRGGRPLAITAEKKDAVFENLKSGKSKASICRTLGIKRSTLYDLLKRCGLEDG